MRRDSKRKLRVRSRRAKIEGIENMTAKKALKITKMGQQAESVVKAIIDGKAERALSSTQSSLTRQ